MTSQELIEARKYEEIEEKKVGKESRPDFHLSPRIGWMNDPNGFSYYNGKYHLFYQYYPYDSQWGPMHWGHAVTDDFLHWEYLPAAMAPDQLYDQVGCFSGSAIELPDGRHLLMYTGVRAEDTADGTVCILQTQCIATGDGMNYEKYGKNPVLDEEDLPEGSSRHDFRDPKIWRKKDGSYCCITACRSSDGSGDILLFTSSDGFEWKYEKVLISNHNRYGKIWECPDLFSLDGKGVLLTSPQDMLAEGYEHCSGNGTLCIIGDFSEDTNVFTEQYHQSIDYGIDFYAPQTIETPDGRRIMIGWMNNWDSVSIVTPKEPWRGQMSLPREISVSNGRLIQKPIRELEKLRSNRVSYKNIIFAGEKKLEGIKGRKIDMEVEAFWENANTAGHQFEVRFAQNSEYWTSLLYEISTSVMVIDRRHSGSRRGIVHRRECLVNKRSGSLKLRFILDCYSAEIFINDGENVITVTLCTDQEADGISFFSDAEMVLNVLKYDLD